MTTTAKNAARPELNKLNALLGDSAAKAKTAKKATTVQPAAATPATATTGTESATVQPPSTAAEAVAMATAARAALGAAPHGEIKAAADHLDAVTAAVIAAGFAAQVNAAIDGNEVPVAVAPATLPDPPAEINIDVPTATPAAENEVFVPSAANAPAGHRFCRICHSHQPNKKTDPTSTAGEGMCKSTVECRQREAAWKATQPAPAKNSLAAKAKAASAKAKATGTTRGAQDYSAKTATVKQFRAGTKFANMIEALRAENGASLAELAALMDTSEGNCRHRATYMAPRAGYNVVAVSADRFRITN